MSFRQHCNVAFLPGSASKERRSISITTHSQFFYLSTPRDPTPPHYNTNPRQDKGTGAGALPGLLFSIIIEDRVERCAAQSAMENIDRSLGSGLVPDWFRLRSGVVVQRKQVGHGLAYSLVPVWFRLVPVWFRLRAGVVVRRKHVDYVMDSSLVPTLFRFIPAWFRCRC